MSAILGVLFAALVSIFGLHSLTELKKDSDDTLKYVATANQQKTLNEAASRYIKQYSVQLQTAATPSTPAVITVPMLQSVNVGLSPAFSALNPYGQTWQVAVLQPTPGSLRALSMSTGGTALTDRQVAKIAQIVNGPGGFIPLNDSGIYPGGAANAYGAFSGWNLSTAGYSGVAGGHLASLISFDNGQLTNNYLYRNAVPGQPQLNQMNTTLDMNGNSVVNANALNGKTLATTSTATIGGNTSITGTLTATDNISTTKTISTGKLQLQDVVVEGTSCPANGLVARDATGLPLSCQSGLWKRLSISLTQNACYWANWTFGYTDRRNAPASICTPGYYVAGFQISAEDVVGNVPVEWDAGRSYCCPGQ